MAYVIVFPDNYLDIAGVPLSTPAWEVLNLETILSGPDVRGEPRLMPGAIGVRANPLRAGVWTLSLELAIYGDKDPEGVVHADAHHGLMANVDRLKTDVTDPIMADRSTRLATWHRGPDLAALTATVQVHKFDVGSRYSPSEVSASIDLSIITGMFR